MVHSQLCFRKLSLEAILEDPLLVLGSVLVFLIQKTRERKHSRGITQLLQMCLVCRLCKYYGTYLFFILLLSSLLNCLLRHLGVSFSIIFCLSLGTSLFFACLMYGNLQKVGQEQVVLQPSKTANYLIVLTLFLIQLMIVFAVQYVENHLSWSFVGTWQ